jgi:hypothetical protein
LPAPVGIRTEALLQYVQMSKLTLSVDPTVISLAKRYAKEQGVSVSEMVEVYLSAVARPSHPRLVDSPPVLRSVRGILKRGTLEDHRRYLARKYR